MGNSITNNSLVRLTFLSTTDEHGHLLPEKVASKNNQNGEQGGFAYIAGKVDEIRKKNPNTLLTSSGDFFQGTPVSEMFNGSPMIDIMNTMKYDAMEIGNHDFDFNIPQLLYLLGKGNFPALGSNIIRRENGSASSSKTAHFVQPYILKKIDGVTIGIAGIDTQEVPDLIPSKKYVSEYNFSSPKETLQHIIPEMKEKGAEIIVLLSHQGTKEDIKLAKEVDGIDLIWGGHTHEFFEKPITVRKTTIGQAGCYGQALGQIDCYYDKVQKKIIKTKYDLIPIDPKKIEANKQISELIENYNVQTKGILSQVIGFADVDLKHSSVKAGNLDNYIVDHVKTAGNAEIAFVNAQGIRQSLLAGNITISDLYQVSPFHTNTIAMELTGSQVKKLLEHSAELNDERSLYVSKGVKVIYDTSKPVGARLISVTLNGEPLNDNKVYSISCDGFLANGGLGYNEFLNGTNIKEGMKIRDMLSEAIKLEKHINPKEETRIEDIAPKALSNPTSGKTPLSLPNRTPLPAQL